MSAVPARAVAAFRRRAFVRLLAATPYDGGDPLAASKDNQALWEVFEDEGDLLAALQEHWTELLNRRIFAEPSYPLGSDRLRELYADLAKEHGTLYAVLSAQGEDPAIANSVMAEHVLLARAAGHLDTRASASTLVWRARDLIASIPSQRTNEHVSA